MARKRQYVGIRRDNFKYERFASEETPGLASHSQIYAAIIGPFRTARGAQYMADYGRGNPHLQHVDDAERFARNA